MKELQTERLVICKAEYDIVDQISEGNSTDHVTEYMNSLAQKDIEIILQDKNTMIDLVSRLSKRLNSESNEYYAAYLGNTPIGYIALADCESALPELQIEIAREHQGIGYGYEFLAAFLEFLFEEGRYSCVQYTVLPNNEASIDLVSKIGAFKQKPPSQAESLLIRTYHISKLSMDAYAAHDFCSNHKPELERDERCGCFDCLRIFHPSEIEEWIIEDNPCDRRGTAICPHCGIDSIIGESSGYPITKEFLEAMEQIWFH